MIGSLTLLVLAFGTPQTFDAPAAVGGGSSTSFTGAPSSKWNCGVCHSESATPATDALTVTSIDRDLATQGYEPGQTYELEIELHGATGDRAGFSLEATVPIGGAPFARASGTLTPHAFGGANDPFTCPDTSAVGGFEPVVVQGTVARTYACKLTKWRVSWTAPASDEGSVTLYASAVDGDNDSTNQGDLAHSVVIGIPSPSTLGKRSAGCSTSPVGVVLVLALVLLLRRRRAALSVALTVALLATPAMSAGKKGKKTPKVTKPAPEPGPAPAPTPTPEPAPEPAPAPPVTATPPTPAPAPVAKPADDSGKVTASIPDTSNAPAGVELDARVGFGFRTATFSSASYATPLGVSFGYPSLGLGVTVYPFRLLRTSALEGLHVQGRYTVGWVLASLPLSGALALPSDGRVALGYLIRAGVLQLAPRALYSVVIGGVERNAVFDDGYFQSLGGELLIGVDTGGFFVNVTPRFSSVVDVGTQMVRGYGVSKGGLTAGGAAEVGFRFGTSVTLSASYSFNWARTSFGGQGVRSLEALTLSDVTHAGFVALTLAR